MYIEPNTNIRLLKGVPLDTTYGHTIWFDSPTAQANWFIGKTKHDLSNYTYQRVNKGVARIGRSADQCYDCNYMMFRNTSYGNKWFYAFIKSVEYLNNETCQITFEIDVIQTWLFDINFRDTFVEREHSLTDNIGDNILPEPVDIGEQTFMKYERLSAFNFPVVVALTTEDISIDKQGSRPWVFNYYKQVYGSMWSGAGASDALFVALDRILKIDKESVLALYLIPADMLNLETIGYDKAMNMAGISMSESTLMRSRTFSLPSRPSTFTGHLVKNKKLLTYPYCYLQVDNSNGSTLTLRYEYFDTGATQCIVRYNAFTPTEMRLVPYKYKTPINQNTAIETESLVIDNFPMCAWTSDTFRAWLAQNANVSLVTGSASVVGGALGYAYGASRFTKIGAVLGAATAIGNILSSGYKASLTLHHAQGNFSNTGGANWCNGNTVFRAGTVICQPQYAKVIDDYFTKFGYACNCVKTPNRSSRPHWNYVKTLGCDAEGSAPADDVRRFCEIHDAGVTYWKNGDEVGNYSLDNSPS